MSFFFILILALAAGDVFWWRWADVRAKTFPRAKLWRVALLVFCSLQFLGYIGILGGRFAGIHARLPAMILAPIYLWHLVVLPITWIVIGLIAAGRLAKALAKPSLDEARDGQAVPQADGLSRRNFLGVAAVSIPPLVTGGAVLTSFRQLDKFRINRITIPLARLPRELDGLTIAHVSDIHIGRFTREAMLPRLADATNALRADLVLLTGDLIDFAITDLPAGIDFLRRLDARSGIATIQGNHDLFEDRERFERDVPASGVPLLLNDGRTFRVRGRDVQVLGMKWGAGRMRTAMHEEHARATLQKLSPDPATFPILLSHHPHAFDLAAQANVPLTLAGHTHGGQIMLTETIGPGSLMYKYWSGLYRKGDNALVVSNGVGNWFPLRINAPAEIVHITLRAST